MAQKRSTKETGEASSPAAKATGSKTSRTRTSRRQAKSSASTKAQSSKYKFDAFPDRVDIRDWFFQPSLKPLPDQIVNCQRVPKILDQHSEGACTGFALAAVINYQLADRGLITSRHQERLVSPRMLYEMSRHYDEWPGESYEGSSARGAMKGWVAHGVTRQSLWPDDKHGSEHLTYQVAQKAQETPGGAYYRVMHRNIRDVHAALYETGILFATLMVHDGWFEPGPDKEKISYELSGNLHQIELPIIAREGRATQNGHAIAIVGYTYDGFIVQNSWGESWGTDGFALLPYEDWMLHATDCWVAQLGVPISLNVWYDSENLDTRGFQRASRVIPLSEIRPFVIDVGNNGLLSNSGKYWTTQQDLTYLLEAIRDRSKTWPKCRIMLYLHGGLNKEVDVANRIVALRDVCLANKIYPVHVMWETGFMESLKASVLDLFTNKDERAAADWFDRLREGLVEAKDRSIELTAAAPGTHLWKEMKENAALASENAEGGMKLFCQEIKKLLANLNQTEKDRWELHVVGHSAGSIFAAFAIKLLADLELDFKTIQFMAPAIRTDLFKTLILSQIQDGKCPHPTLYILSDEIERDDTVGPYGKSLLYLVSNAFEGKRETPLLGMERFIRADDTLDALFKTELNGLPSLNIAGQGDFSQPLSPSLSHSQTHGGFDNDPYSLNSVLYRILGEEPLRPFTDRDLQY